MFAVGNNLDVISENSGLYLKLLNKLSQIYHI